jgi:hypothetical protein
LKPLATKKRIVFLVREPKHKSRKLLRQWLLLASPPLHPDSPFLLSKILVAFVTHTLGSSTPPLLLVDKKKCDCNHSNHYDLRPSIHLSRGRRECFPCSRSSQNLPTESAVGR